MFLWGIWTVQRRRCPPAGHAICVARCVASQWRWWGRQMEQLIALCACICGIHIWYVTVWAVCISYSKETSRQGRHISTCMSGDSWPSTAQPSPTKRQLPICSADLASWKFVNLGTLPNSPPISESQMDSQCLQTGVPSLGPFFGCESQDGETQRLFECFMYIVLFHFCHGGSCRHTFAMAMYCKLELNIALHNVWNSIETIWNT